MTEPQTGGQATIDLALTAMIDEFEEIDGWAAELAAEHADCLGKLNRIRRSFMDMVNLLPRQRRMDHVRNFAAVLPSRTRGQRPRTQLAGELETFFRVHRGAEFTAGEVHQWLSAAGIPFPRGRIGNELARRAREGQLRRTGRGAYEVVLTIREQLGR